MNNSVNQVIRYATVILLSLLLNAVLRAPVEAKKPQETVPEPVSVSVFQAVNNAGQRVVFTVFDVPPGKILAVDYVSMFLDVVVTNRPSSGLRILGVLQGSNPNNPGIARFEIGYMEEFPLTSRGTPNFVVTGRVPVYFGAGPVQCEAETAFGGVVLDFGGARCSLSGQLINKP